MINLFFVILFSILIIGITVFINNKLNIKAKELEQKEIFLKTQINNLELQEKDFEIKYAAGKQELSERKVEISKYYKQVLAEREDTHNMQEHFQNHINLLKKQITNLQTELSHARQKSKRLAKKAKNTV